MCIKFGLSLCFDIAELYKLINSSFDNDNISNINSNDLHQYGPLSIVLKLKKWVSEYGSAVH